MRRRRRDEAIERFRDDRNEAVTTLAQMARRWVDDHIEDLREADPEIPTELHDRAADNWRPLLAIADAAGAEWPRLSRMVARSMSESTTPDQESIRTMLLADIQSAFQNTDRLSSDTLVATLVSLEDRPWSEMNKGRPLTKTGLARLLKVFKIFPTTIRLEGDRTAKGYYRSNFDDAFARYLPGRTVTA
jgi:Protein of unknown function (DUF3631)